MYLTWELDLLALEWVAMDKFCEYLLERRLIVLFSGAMAVQWSTADSVLTMRVGNL